MNVKTNIYEYIEPNGCHNCKHCFVFGDYSCTLEWYCNLNGDRPKCGSVAMGESEKFDYDSGDLERWHDWEEHNKINPWGICKKWSED